MNLANHCLRLLPLFFLTTLYSLSTIASDDGRIVGEVTDVYIESESPAICVGYQSMATDEISVSGQLNLLSFYSGPFAMKPMSVFGRPIDRKWKLELFRGTQKLNEFLVSELKDKPEFTKDINFTFTSGSSHENDLRAVLTMAMTFALSDKTIFEGTFGVSKPLLFPESSPDDINEYEVPRSSRVLDKVVQLSAQKLKTNITRAKVEVSCRKHFPEQFKEPEITTIALELNKKFSTSAAKAYLQIAKDLAQLDDPTLTDRMILDIIYDFDRAENGHDDAIELLEKLILAQRKNLIQISEFYPTGIRIIEANGNSNTDDSKSLFNDLYSMSQENGFVFYDGLALAYIAMRRAENDSDNPREALKTISNNRRTWLNAKESIGDQADYYVQILRAEGGASNSSDALEVLNKVYDVARQTELRPSEIVSMYKDLLRAEGGSGATSDALEDLNLLVKNYLTTKEVSLINHMQIFIGLLGAEGGSSNTSDAQQAYQDIVNFYHETRRFDNSVTLENSAMTYRQLLRAEGGSSATGDATDALKLIQRTVVNGQYQVRVLLDAYTSLLKLEGGSSNTSDAVDNLKLVLDHSTVSTFPERFRVFSELLSEKGSSKTSSVQSLFKDIY